MIVQKYSKFQLLETWAADTSKGAPTKKEMAAKYTDEQSEYYIDKILIETLDMLQIQLDQAAIELDDNLIAAIKVKTDWELLNYLKKAYPND